MTMTRKPCEQTFVYKDDCDPKHSHLSHHPPNFHPQPLFPSNTGSRNLVHKQQLLCFWSDIIYFYEQNVPLTLILSIYSFYETFDFVGVRCSRKTM